MKIGPVPIQPNESAFTYWLRDGANRPLDGRFTRLSIQFVDEPAAWVDLIMTLVVRVDENCAAIAAPGVSTFTAAAKYQFNIDVSGYSDVGLSVTTVEGADFTLNAYAFLGVQPWPSA